LAEVMSDTDSSSDKPRSGSSIDLYPTSDIRFVMVEIGKLSTKADRLIADVEKLGGKVEVIGHQISFFKGAFWIASAVFGVCVLAIGWLFTTHAIITFH
jgi:hypothetical protein